MDNEKKIQEHEEYVIKKYATIENINTIITASAIFFFQSL